jgi:hypothetical protein
MAFVHEKRTAARMLEALEDGNLEHEDTRSLLEDADPALVYFLFAWLRVRYHAGHSASDGVLGRIVALCAGGSKVSKMARAGERDALVTWFEETYEYRDIDRDDFISLIVEKLEG